MSYEEFLRRKMNITPIDPLSRAEIEGFKPVMFKKPEEKEEPKEQAPEDWVWIRGFKGTRADMCCRDKRYELNKVYEMDEDVKLCNKGYHLCDRLSDVFRYYDVDKGNRFFEVSALVKRDDYENMIKVRTSPSMQFSIYAAMTNSISDDKLVAKSIIFLRELSIDEVFAVYKDGAYSDWDEADKKEAMMVGIIKVRDRVRTKKLIDLGYNEIFAKYLVNDGKFDVAYAVANQPGLSMEMKCLAIFAGGSDD